MSLRSRSVMLRVALLVLVPLVFLVGIFTYSITTSARAALVLIRSKVMVEDLGPPVAHLQRALTDERAQVSVYYANPTPTALAQLRRRQVITARAAGDFTAAARSAPVRHSASPAGQTAIAALGRQLKGLPKLRTKITSLAMTVQQAFSAYNGMIAASYRVLEQAIRQEGPSTQVLPAIAVIELAISNEYLHQESALLNGSFAARAFPASAHHGFVSLVGAHRLLYAQSYSYLSAQDRRQLNHDLSPTAARTLAMLENKLVNSRARHRPPIVSPRAWNSTVAVVSAQIQRAVGQAEARLVARARAQANATLRDLYLAGGIGLAAVIVSFGLSWWLAFRLARQLRGLRDSAQDLATVRLPDVIGRLRAGREVDVTAEVPPLKAGADEIGQVEAAINAAQRTAVEAAVQEARLRQGINDVFRNLAGRSQSLLERQLELLDALERRTDKPDDLEGLFRMDHLSTRMRRHAESLIVLAGDAPRRVFRDPVPFVDVLRAAAAEVEDYTRIRVTCRAAAWLAGPAVADVIHMLAEFTENAASFSPASTEVGITGSLVATGFAIDIEDRGPGMSHDEIAAANATLACPPEFDPSGSDRLGLFVAAQLARRHGIQVTLRRSPYGGVTAIVLIPQDLVVLADAIEPPDVVVDDEATDPSPMGSATPTGAAQSELPRRHRQSSLAPQLLDTAMASAPVPELAVLRSAESGLSVISAFRAGWQRGASEGEEENR
jgi:signal transduction histidine kinase